MSFATRKQAIAEGEAAATAVIGRLKALIARVTAQKRGGGLRPEAGNISGPSLAH